MPTEKPVLGLMLRYIVTTFGSTQELEAEQLLGIIVTHLHTNATLTRAEILAIKAALPRPSSPTPISTLNPNSSSSPSWPWRTRT
jgi:hypothetical protein